MLPIAATSTGILFQVYVQPKSSRNAIVGVYGDALKIKLTAPPVDGAANAACIKFLAKCLQVPKSSVEIVSGRTSRHKQIHIQTEGSELIRIKERLESLANL